jgi:hypothetical protein
MKTTIFNKARLMGTCFLWAALATGGVLTSCSDDDDLTALTSPTGSEAAEVTATSLTFSWNKVSGVNQYGLVLKNEAGETVATDVTTAHTATFYGLQPGKTYTLEVTAYAGLGTDYANSKPLVLTGTTLSFIQLEAPVVTATPAARTQISWAAVENATGYTYTYDYYGQTVTGSTTGTSIIIDFLKLNTEIPFTVYATNEENELYLDSEAATVVLQRTRTENIRRTGVLSGTDTKVDIVYYSDGSYSLKGWYGVEGYDLDFYVDTENGYIVTDTDQWGGYNYAYTGTAESYMYFYTTYPDYSGFDGNMREGGVWFTIYPNSGTAYYYLTWPAPVEEEDLGELYIPDVTFYGSSILGEFKADLYKKTQDDGTVLYAFKNFMENYNLKFTLDESGNMTFPELVDTPYGGYDYALFGADWYTSYPLFLTAEKDYYLDYAYFCTSPGWTKLVLNPDEGWSFLTFSYTKMNINDFSYTQGSFDYIYMKW